MTQLTISMEQWLRSLSQVQEPMIFITAATLPDAWHYEVSAGTGWPSVDWSAQCVSTL